MKFYKKDNSERMFIERLKDKAASLKWELDALSEQLLDHENNALALDWKWVLPNESIGTNYKGTEIKIGYDRRWDHYDAYFFHSNFKRWEHYNTYSTIAAAEQALIRVIDGETDEST